MINHEKIGNIVVVTAGTADIPVAEEASITAETLGHHVNRIYDAGVAELRETLHFFYNLAAFAGINQIPYAPQVIIQKKQSILFGK